MPCRWASRPCSRRARTVSGAVAAGGLPTPTSNPDVESWKDIRKFNLRMMRKQVRYIVLVMALLEVLRIGPMELAYAGTHEYAGPGENDFGIAYTVARFLSWLYLCVFMVVWMPLFNWWVPKVFPDTPEDPSKPSYAMSFFCLLKKLDMFLLPVAVGISFAVYVFYVLHTFVYVESRPYGSNKLPKNNRRNWACRFLMLNGIAITTSLGYGVFHILAEVDLAHVKPLEYALVVVPVQVNLGIFLGSIMQIRMMKRIARKQELAQQAAKAEDGVQDEKAALVDV